MKQTSQNLRQDQGAERQSFLVNCLCTWIQLDLHLRKFYEIIHGLISFSWLHCLPKGGGEFYYENKAAGLKRPRGNSIITVCMAGLGQSPQNTQQRTEWESRLSRGWQCMLMRRSRSIMTDWATPERGQITHEVAWLTGVSTQHRSQASIVTLFGKTQKTALISKGKWSGSHFATVKILCIKICMNFYLEK